MSIVHRAVCVGWDQTTEPVSHCYICVITITFIIMVTRISIILVSSVLYLVSAGDINRQSIIFNENTPDVFYCPQVRLGNCDLSHPFCKLWFQFSGETYFYWPNVSEKQTNEEVVWIWRKRAAWKCEVWLLEWCRWDWICLLSKCNHFMKHWHWLFLEPKEVF